MRNERSKLVFMSIILFILNGCGEDYEKTSIKLQSELDSESVKLKNCLVNQKHSDSQFDSLQPLIDEKGIELTQLREKCDGYKERLDKGRGEIEKEFRNDFEKKARNKEILIVLTFISLFIAAGYFVRRYLIRVENENEKLKEGIKSGEEELNNALRELRMSSLKIDNNNAIIADISRDNKELKRKSKIQIENKLITKIDEYTIKREKMLQDVKGAIDD